jgi:catechol 2,3-dioxygenase-like lactoylglutathione lyase family enzyme
MAIPDRPQIHGWREALISVSDIDRWVAAYRQLGGWEIRHRDSLAAETLSFLGLPEDMGGEEVLLAEPGSETGFARLVHFAGLHPAIRSNARPWETGGWYDVNSRVVDMDSIFSQLQELGWSGEADPIIWNFQGKTVNELLARAPDGIVFALIQRIDPPLPPEQQPGKLSAHINATQIVTDIAAAKNFYQDILGFKPIIKIDDEPMLPEPAPNVFGLPDEVALRQNWNICLQEAPAGDGGWVEIVSLPGLSGRDFAERTDPPNRGIISLRFPVNDLLTLHDYLLGNGVCIVQAPTTLHIEPYGDVSILTARGPQGVRLDFFQT